MLYSGWPGAVAYREILKLTLSDKGVMQVEYDNGTKAKTTIPMKSFGTRQQEALDAINRYYGRYMHAMAYQEQKQKEVQPV
jgi:hypothetical protein